MRKVIVILIAIFLIGFVGMGKDVKTVKKDVKGKSVEVKKEKGKKERKAKEKAKKDKKKVKAKEKEKVKGKKETKGDKKSKKQKSNIPEVKLSELVKVIEKSYTPVEQGGYEATAEVFRKAGITPSMSINEIAAKAVKNASEIKREPYREGGEMVIYDWYINVDSLFGSSLFNFTIKVRVIDDRAGGVGITGSITFYNSYDANKDSVMLSVLFEDLDDWVVDNPEANIGYSIKKRDGPKKLNEFIRAFKVPVRMDESTVVDMIVVSTPLSNYVIYPKNIDDPAQGVDVVEIPEGWIGTIAVYSAINDGPNAYGCMGIIDTFRNVVDINEYLNIIENDGKGNTVRYNNIIFDIDIEGYIKYKGYDYTYFGIDEEEFISYNKHLQKAKEK